MEELTPGMWPASQDVLTPDEIALYDRQIRLWGMGTQLRLRSAKLLVVNFGAVSSEVVKNLVLGGINSIEILDGAAVKADDFAAQFFLPNDQSIVGQPKLPVVLDAIKELNSRVDVTINRSSVDTVLSEDPDYFKKFDLIIGTELSKAQILKLNDLTRSLKIPLYVSGVHGMFGYIITDLIDHTCVNEKDIGNQPRKPNTELNPNKVIVKVDVNKAGDKEVLTIQDTYSPIRDLFESKTLPSRLTRRQLRKLSPAVPLILTLLEFDHVTRDALRERASETCKTLGISPDIITDEYLDLFVAQAFTEFAPVSAIIGGALAQDIIQFLSRKESPINNYLVLDSLKSEMPIFTL